MPFIFCKKAPSIKLEILDLGLMEYGEAWKKQLEMLEARAAGRIPDTLIFVEHPHVITMGKKTPNLASLIEQKNWQDIPLFAVERGGQFTYHGPGQLIAYPIFLLPEKMGAVGFLRVLEKTLINTLAEVGLTAFAEPGATGVWLKDSASHTDKKIASLGIAVRSGVSYHGLALNVSTDLKYFSMIQPCGFSPDIMTSLFAQDVRCRMQDMKDILAVELENTFSTACSQLS